jgi:hypothetical protein
MDQECICTLRGTRDGPDFGKKGAGGLAGARRPSSSGADDDRTLARARTLYLRWRCHSGGLPACSFLVYQDMRLSWCCVERRRGVATSSFLLCSRTSRAYGQREKSTKQEHTEGYVSRGARPQQQPSRPPGRVHAVLQCGKAASTASQTDPGGEPRGDSRSRWLTSDIA